MKKKLTEGQLRKLVRLIILQEFKVASQRSTDTAVSRAAGLDSGGKVEVEGEIDDDMMLMPDNDKSMTAVDPEFQKLVQPIMKKLEAKGYQPMLGSAYRSPKSQLEKIKTGKSKTKTVLGYHVALDEQGNKAALAVDLVDKRYGWGSSEKGTKEKAYEFFAALGEICKSADFSSKVKWGGDWEVKDRKVGSKVFKIGWDPAHIQTRRMTMAQSATRTRKGIAVLKSKSRAVS